MIENAIELYILLQIEGEKDRARKIKKERD